MDSMYQAGCQFDQISPPPRVLRKAKSIYDDGFSEAPQSSMLMSRMSSLCQEAKRKARLRRMLTMNYELGEPAHFERTSPSPPRMQNTLHPNDLSGVNISPRMTRAPLTRMSTYYCGGGGSQYEAASPPSYTLRPESSHLSPASSKKVNMFELAHSMEKIRSLDASKLSPELQVRIIEELGLHLFFSSSGKLRSIKRGSMFPICKYLSFCIQVQFPGGMILSLPHSLWYIPQFMFMFNICPQPNIPNDT